MGIRLLLAYSSRNVANEDKANKLNNEHQFSGAPMIIAFKIRVKSWKWSNVLY